MALISLERSEHAWSTVHAALKDPGSAALLAAIHRVRERVQLEFPDAMRFRRPGFDDR